MWNWIRNATRSGSTDTREKWTTGEQPNGMTEKDTLLTHHPFTLRRKERRDQQLFSRVDTSRFGTSQRYSARRRCKRPVSRDPVADRCWHEPKATRSWTTRSYWRAPLD